MDLESELQEIAANAAPSASSKLKSLEFILGLYRVYIGIMEKKMETTIVGLVLIPAIN